MAKRREPARKAPESASEPGFEAGLAQLEALVERLESADLPLEEALATFEAGVALTRTCSEQLEDAERRIEILVREGGRWVTRPHDVEAAQSDGSE